MREKLAYVKYILVHPFDGFYEAKYRGKGSMILAFLFMMVFCILKCVEYQYTGFVMNNNYIYDFNSFTIFLSNLSIFVLFILGNYAVTTLFNGKGGIKDIFMVISYALVPMIIVNSITILASNFIIAEEVVLLTAFRSIGTAWFAFVAIAGLGVIHEYKLIQNFITLIATLVAAAIIIFLFVLFISLVEQLIGFVSTIFSEALRRI